MSWQSKKCIYFTCGLFHWHLVAFFAAIFKDQKICHQLTMNPQTWERDRQTYSHQATGEQEHATNSAWLMPLSNQTCCQSLLIQRALSSLSLVRTWSCCALLQSKVPWLPSCGNRMGPSSVCVSVCARVGKEERQQLHEQGLFLSKGSRPPTQSPHIHVFLLRDGK